jgi:DNA-directed RNA polymerase specialized sigma24 family protein
MRGSWVSRFEVRGSRFEVQERVPRRDVDDLVQEVFIVAYTRIGELREQLGWRGE